jgi:hypothetical protein
MFFLKQRAVSFALIRKMLVKGATISRDFNHESKMPRYTDEAGPAQLPAQSEGCPLNGLIRKGVSHGAVSELAVSHIQGQSMPWGLGCERIHTQTSQLPEIGQGCITQGLAGGSAHGSGHIGHAVEYNPIYNIGGIVVGRGPGHFRTSPLINAHIHYHTAGSHVRQHGPLNQLGCTPTRNQNCPHDQDLHFELRQL